MIRTDKDLVKQLQDVAARITAQAASPVGTQKQRPAKPASRPQLIAGTPQGERERADVATQLAQFDRYANIYKAAIEFHKTYCTVDTTQDFAALPKELGRISAEFGRNTFMRELLETIYRETMRDYNARHPQHPVNADELADEAFHRMRQPVDASKPQKAE